MKKWTLGLAILALIVFVMHQLHRSGTTPPLAATADASQSSAPDKRTPDVPVSPVVDRSVLSMIAPPARSQTPLHVDFPRGEEVDDGIEQHIALHRNPTMLKNAEHLPTADSPPLVSRSFPLVSPKKKAMQPARLLIEPTAVKLTFALDELTTYQAAARKAQFRPAELVHNELLACLATQGIPEYPGDKVHQYLKAQAKDLGKTYVWVPLRASDRERWRANAGGVWTHRDASREMFGSVQANGHYQKIVPEPVLALVAQVEQYVPEATFYVSDIVDFKDPFLAVGVGQFPMAIIAVWDEPGFKCEPLKRVPPLLARK